MDKTRQTTFLMQHSQTWDVPFVRKKKIQNCSHKLSLLTHTLLHSELTGIKIETTDAIFVSVPERKRLLGDYKLFNTEFNSPVFIKLKF